MVFNIRGKYIQPVNKTIQNIISAGGKKVTEIEPEGKLALMQHFEDTEGNYVGLYQINK